MKLQKILLSVFTVGFISLCCGNAFADVESQALVRGIRPMSMGGAFVAVADDENAFFYNPAGISQRQDWLIQIFSLDASVNSETFKFAEFYNDNRDDLNDFDKLPPQQQADLIMKINNKIIGKTPNVLLSLPNIAYLSSPFDIFGNQLNFGAGIFSYFDAQFRFNRSLVPSLSYYGELTALAAVPVSYKINSLEKIKVPGKLAIGANFKYIYRGKVEDNNLSIAEFENLNEIPMQTGGGFGVDFGLLYSLNSRWNIGLQLTDAFTTKIDYSEYKDNDHPSRSKDSYTAEIKPELNAGAAYFPEKIYFWPGKYIETNRNVTIAADLSDITNDDETLGDSFWKKVHLGAELKLYPFSIRAGVNSGYPTFGAGIGTRIVQFEYAFYGEEEGRYAGQDPEWFHRIHFSVKIGGADKAQKKEKSKAKENDKGKKDKPEAYESGVAESESEKENSDDIKPAAIPKDAKDTISKEAKITEIK